MSFEKPDAGKEPSVEGFTGSPKPAYQLEAGMHSIDHDKEILSVTDQAGGYRIIFKDSSSITLDRDDTILIKNP